MTTEASTSLTESMKAAVVCMYSSALCTDPGRLVLPMISSLQGIEGGGPGTEGGGPGTEGGGPPPCRGEREEDLVLRKDLILREEDLILKEEDLILREEVSLRCFLTWFLKVESISPSIEESGK